MDTSAETIEKLFWESPQEVQDFLESEHLLETVQTIAEEHRLHLDQLSQLSEEIVAVGLGATRPENFSKNISQKLEISSEKSEQITKTINEKIFRPIKNLLVKKYDEEEDHSQLSREDLLREIEVHVSTPSKPTPIIVIEPEHTLESPPSRKELDAPQAPKPTPNPIISPQSKPTEEIAKLIPTILKTENKSNSVTVATQTKVEITEQKAPSTPTKRASDPYREPVE